MPGMLTVALLFAPCYTAASMPRTLASYVAVGVLALSIAACGGGGDDIPSATDSEASADSITSADGSLTLSVPAAALPEGTTADSITITTLASDDLDYWKEGTIFAAYDLQPDGLEFAEPVPVTLRLPLPTAGISFRIMLLGDLERDELDFEGVRVLGVEPDEDTGELIVNAELSHFSNMIVSEGFFDVSLQAPDTVVVDVPFTANARVHLTTRAESLEYTFDGEEVVYTKTARGGWELEGIIRGSTRLSPRRVTDRPPLTSLNSRSTTIFSVPQMFTCERQGPFKIDYLATLNTEGHSTVVRLDGSIVLESSDGFRLFPTRAYVFVEGFCQPAPPGPSPSPRTTDAVATVSPPESGPQTGTGNSGTGQTPTDSQPTVLPPGDYSLTFTGTQTNCPDSRSSFTSSLQIEVRESLVEGEYSVTIRDGRRTPYRGTMSITTGQFTADLVNDQYSGRLLVGFTGEMQRTVSVPGCIAVYQRVVD